MQAILLILLLGATSLVSDGSAHASPQAAPRAAETGSAPAGPADPGPGASAAAAAAAPQLAVAPAIAALHTDLNSLIASTGWRDALWSVMVVSLDRGDTIYAHNPDLALAPASNMKLFTTAAALYYLGPEYRYGTYLLTQGTVRSGVLHGDLVLYGTGDPTISERFFGSKLAVFEAFADSLAALGIREIRGDVVGDASYFGDDGAGLGWLLDYMNASYAAPASALTFNENIVTLRITPAEQAGWRPTILKIPGGDGISIVNQATTVAGGRTWIDVDRAAYDGPIVVRGRIAMGNPGVWRAVPVADPAHYAAAVLREVLVRRGIAVTGGIRSIHSPTVSPVTSRTSFAPVFEDGPGLHVLAVHHSPPLQEILTVINKKSHNLYAESVLRTVGRVAFGDGSVHGGARAVYDLLGCETEEDLHGLRMLDGSGLSVLNRASARSITHLLTYMAQSPVWAYYWATLPEAGDPGGLPRMHNTRAAGNLRAKTGTINRVSALSGYVRAANGERLAFSIISNNDRSTWRAKRVEDAIGARLARFDRPFHPPSGPSPVPGGTTAAPAAPGSQAPGGQVGTAADSLAPLVTPDSAGAGSAARVSPVAWPADPSRAETYVVRKGDTLEGIAKRHNTTVRALREANPGVNPRRLLPGQRLRLP